MLKIHELCPYACFETTGGVACLIPDVIKSTQTKSNRWPFCLADYLCESLFSLCNLNLSWSLICAYSRTRWFHAKLLHRGASFIPFLMRLIFTGLDAYSSADMTPVTAGNAPARTSLFQTARPAACPWEGTGKLCRSRPVRPNQLVLSEQVVSPIDYVQSPTRSRSCYIFVCTVPIHSEIIQQRSTTSSDEVFLRLNESMRNRRRHIAPQATTRCPTASELFGLDRVLAGGVHCRSLLTLVRRLVVGTSASHPLPTPSY